MTVYIIRRLIQAVIVLILSSLLVFLAMRLLPGDPILMVLTSGQMTDMDEEQIQEIRAEYGMDKPLVVQYVNWWGGILHGDFGISISTKQPVIKEIIRPLPITLHLSLIAFILSIIVGVPAGVICAIRRGTWLDTVITIMANIGVTIPVFWLGIIMIYIFALELGWLPTFGYTSPFTDFWMSTKQIIMPVICLSLFPIASVTRQSRSSILEVMRMDYVRTAWSKGLKERAVIMKHALKNGLLPVVTLCGLTLAFVIGGSVLVETVFNIPGIGRMMVNAVFSHDYPIIQGFVLMIAIMMLLINLITDISYCWFDPRIRYD